MPPLRPVAGLPSKARQRVLHHASPQDDCRQDHSETWRGLRSCQTSDIAYAAMVRVGWGSSPATPWSSSSISTGSGAWIAPQLQQTREGTSAMGADGGSED